MKSYGQAVCLDCKVTFEKGSGNAKRCRLCSMKKQGSTGVGFIPKPCKICGNDFTPTGSTQCYCKTCKPIAYKANNAASLDALRRARGVVKIGSEVSCSECGSSFIFKHGVQKKCPSCVALARRIAARAYHKSNPEKIKKWAKASHSNGRMGGSRKIVLKRDNHTCQKCGKQPANVVHHIDCFGEKSGTPNNSIDNLVTLCASCHAGVHAMIDKLTRERHQGTILEAYAAFNHSHWTPQA